MATFKGSTGEILIDDIDFKPESRKQKVIMGCLCLVLFVIAATFASLYALEITKDNPGASSAATGQSKAELTTSKPPTKPPKTTLKPSVVPTTKGSQAYWNVRLPENIIPEHYDVFLNVNLKKLAFSGKTTVNVNVKKATSYVIIHVKNMNVTKAEVRDASKNLATNEKFEFKKNEFYVIKLANDLSPGKYKLYYEYSAYLATDLKGFYKSTYKRANGKTITIAATQFQPTDARRAFPCFDEPAMKATFAITIAHDPKMIAISNMPIEGTKTDSGLKVDQFQKTAIMPTYLIAFVICDFGHVTTTTSTNVSMTYYAPPDQTFQLNYAVKIGKKILPYFESYYNVTYPLPKADMIAIPDFSAGAMENWGLITYRETALLYQPGESSESNKQRVAIVISHELAHQWFGNLVTNKWWSDLWLNEGFASFVEYHGVDDSEPSWKIKDQFVVKDLRSAFAADALVTSHPIYVPVNHPNEINEIFDSISYSKGGSVLRMLDNFLSKDIFVKGLTSYLNKYKYSNAETKDLWASLSEASGTLDVGQVMDTWTKQMGYPVVNVTTNADGSVQLDQERFLLNPFANQSISKYKSPYNYKWVIPFTYQVLKKGSMGTKLGSPKMKWMNLTSATLPAGTKPATSFIKGNIGMYGFYRVNYDAQGWDDITKQLKTDSTVFDSKDRAGLLMDAFALARAGKIGYDVALDLFDYIDNETQYVPWEAGISSIGYISFVLTKTRPANKFYQKYMLKKINKIYNDILSRPSSKEHLDIYLRNSLQYVACGAGHAECINNATSRFQKWLKDEKNKISPDIRSLSYFYGMLNSGQDEWETMFRRYQASTVASERIKLLYGMSAIQEPWMILRYLDYSLDDSKVKSQDTSYIFSYISNSNPVGRHYAWSYLKENWAKIAKKFGGGFFSMRRIVNSVTSGFTTEYELEDFDKFIETIEDRGTADRAITQAREKIKSNIQWLKSNEKVVEKWLRAHV